VKKVFIIEIKKAPFYRIWRGQVFKKLFLTNLNNSNPALPKTPLSRKFQNGLIKCGSNSLRIVLSYDFYYPYLKKGQYKTISILIKMISIFLINLPVDIDQ